MPTFITAGHRSGDRGAGDRAFVGEAVLCEGVGNVAAGAGGLGDAVADGRTEYDTIDYNEALNVKSAQAGR
ncbi:MULTISPECIES: hypothetical protein [Saccharopolyspora]|uniref:hypothetical protein n=1 Tax=Saccharopolyspora TaxID=1835 RepID=UPI000B8908FB|nr:hypothetical protein [Saccharopolyspora flava]